MTIKKDTVMLMNISISNNVKDSDIRQNDYKKKYCHTEEST